MKRMSLCMGIILMAISEALLFGQIPYTISYQGYLTDESGTPVSDGEYNIQFSLYTANDPQELVWTEIQSVVVTNGLFHVYLGIIEPLSPAFDEQYSLGIAIDGGDELSPRTPLASSPYSLRTRGIDDGQVVKSINTLKDSVILEAGENISISEEENRIIISAAGGSENGTEFPEGGVVRSINGLTDHINLVGADGVSVGSVADTLYISAGNARVISSDWQLFIGNNWSDVTNFFGKDRRTYEIDVPEITQNVLDRGMVQVSVRFGGTSSVIQPLPILQSITQQKEQRLAFHLRLGKIVLEYYNIGESSDPGTISGGSNRYMYTITSGI